MDSQSPIKTGQILVGALLFGMLSFAVVAATMGGKLNTSPDPNLAEMLFIVMGVLAVVEFTAYNFLLKPLLIAQVRREALALDESVRPRYLEQRYLIVTILAAALAEGLGLLGAVTVLLTGRLEALAAPGLAAMALLVILPGPYRFERFTRLIENNQPFPPSSPR